MKRIESEKFLQQKKDAMPSITLYFKHFACQYFIFRNENAKKTETAHRQKLSTYRETPCKVTKSALKTKKNHTHWKVCKIALNVLANMGAQTALNYAISAHRCSYLIALFHSSPKRLQLRHKDILPSPPSLNNSAQDKEKREIKNFTKDCLLRWVYNWQLWNKKNKLRNQ